ncbi:DUF4328 domain-containing protein [Novosphingobium sp. BL-8H]|uniref:DUF4328 domain-containing protein n=1 Tax=Novosphingobium sp. BL-8H TaxID=3127640 RepID=UPI0037569A2F
MQGQIAPRDKARLKTYSIVTQVAVAGSALCCIVFVPAMVAMQYIIRSGLYRSPQFQVWAMIAGFTLIIATVLFLIGAVAFLLWFHKAITNLRNVGLSGLVARPLWAVASVFVPVAQLFIPFATMRELWNRSHGEDEYQARASVGTVTTWWTCLLTGTLLMTVQFITAFINLLTPFKIMTPKVLALGLSLAGLAFWCLAAGYLAVIVRRITTAQDSLMDGTSIFA